MDVRRLALGVATPLLLIAGLAYPSAGATTTTTVVHIAPPPPI